MASPAPGESPAGDGPEGGVRAGGLAERALALKLHEQRQWHALLHYRPSLFGGYESITDDPKFFLSPDGKHDPEAELVATLRAFFQQSPRGDEHPRCRFPARYEWLMKELAAEDAAPARRQCPELAQFMETVDPRSAVLIFPEAHMNSPASMFGHTLVRIDSAHESKLVSTAVNYAAITDESLGPLYAIKGLFGLYPGYFSALPYYEKIKEYSHMDNRDIWEYPMGLTEEEVRRMALHTWELKEVFSEYYFFTDNCSYVLLFLIEAARPGLAATQDFFYWVTPLDTVRKLQEAGLLSPPVYRPSRATRISFLADLTSRKHRQTARDIALGRADAPAFSSNPDIVQEEKIKTLDLAAEYLQYLYSAGEVEKEDYSPRLLAMLETRSGLGRFDYDVPVPEPPDQGHGSSRLALGAGSQGESRYALARFRPSYHDLLDPDEGYKRGAAISFFDMELRHLFEEQKTVLHRLLMVDITSLSPADIFFRNVSWKVTAAFMREEHREGRHRTPFVLNTGGGFSFKVSKGGFVHAMLEPALKMGGSLEENYALGLGLSGGLLLPVTERWKFHLRVKGISYELGDEHEAYSFEFDQRLRLTRNNSLRIEAGRRKLDGHYSTDVNLSWNYYF